MIKPDHERIRIYRKHINSIHLKIFKESDPKEFDPISFNDFFKKLCIFMGSGNFNPNWTDEPILLLLKKEESEHPFLVHEEFKKLYEDDVFNSTNIFIVNYAGSICLKEGSYDDYIDADIIKFAEICKKENCIGFELVGKSIKIYTPKKGLIEIIPNVNSLSKSSKINASSEHISNYQSLIDRHYIEDIHREKTIKYWEPGRTVGSHILKKAPEDIFTIALYGFLRSNTVLTEVNIEHKIEGGRDVIDIYAKAEESDISYLFEVKWLGKSISNVEYKDLRANIGLKQIDEYVKGSANKTVGVLLLYDARKKKDEIWFIPKLRNQLNQNVRPPISIPLQDSTASKIAESEVKKLF